MKNIRNLLTKLSSRKFIISLIPTICALFAYFGADDNVVQMVASTAIIIAATVSYIIVEGRVDAKGIASTIKDLADGIGSLTIENEQKDSSERIPIESKNESESLETNLQKEGDF